MTDSLDHLPALGEYGVWRRGGDIDVALAVELEALGFGTLWVGGSPGDDLGAVEEFVAATSRMTIATGIVNIWSTKPSALAASFHRIEARLPGRVVLGLGVGHPEGSGEKAERPYSAMVAYLDALEADGVPRRRMVLAALGPRMLRLARDRTAGAHPYLVTPAHTREARQLVGGGAVLAPEQRVVLRSDIAQARAIGRPSVASPYLGLVNYRRSLERIGFDDADLAGEGSDRLIDALVVSGDDDAVAAGVRAHRDAGADHVAIQLLTAPDDDVVDGFRRLSRALDLPGGAAR